LLLGLLLARRISELVEGISKLGGVEECINAVDEGLEECPISILSNSSFCSRLINLSDSVGHQPQHCPHRRDMHDVTLCLAGSHLINFY